MNRRSLPRGGALGLALLTTLAAGRTGTSQTAQALTSGYHLAWGTGAILGATAIAVAVIALRSPRRQQPDVTRLAAEEAMPGRPVRTT